MPDYRDLAIDAITKMLGYDPYLPSSDALLDAYAEALQAAHLDSIYDIEEGVRTMYAELGDPGWRATPKVLVTYSLRAKGARRAAERQAEVEEPKGERVTFAEFRKRHPHIKFPQFGKELPRV